MLVVVAVVSILVLVAVQVDQVAVEEVDHLQQRHQEMLIAAVEAEVVHLMPHPHLLVLVDLVL
jgi:competence protein ComGC